MAENYYYEDVDDVQEALDHIPVVILLLMASVAFYFQALVTEERFVPALNVIAKRLSISDDVAGATLMAAGASAPELFSNIVSIFITHSALGMGTIVGSEIFNQLIIGGGAVFASKSRKLKLDPTIVVRDVTFYFLSLLILFWTLSDRRLDEDSGKVIVYISWYNGAALLGCYVFYVWVCANFNRWFRRAQTHSDDSFMFYEAFEIISPRATSDDSKNLSDSLSDQMPFVREPPENFHVCVDSSNDQNLQNLVSSNSTMLTELYSFEGAEESQKLRKGCARSCRDARSNLFLLDNIAPTLTEVEDLEEIVRNDNFLGLYLWQRSEFYDKAKIDMNAWQLRWMKFSHNQILALPYKRDAKPDDDLYLLPLLSNLEKDNRHLLIKVTTSHQQHLVFLAPTDTIFSAAVRRFEELLQIPVIEMKYSEEIPAAHEFHESLIEFPRHGTVLQKIFFVLLFPVKALTHFGIPDVRDASDAPTVKASIAAIVSVLFLIVGSFVMVETLECLAHEIHIPEAVVGATISAAGTSLPNFVASQIAARQGLGNMAISNMLGSNTFNILIALGLPWFLYTLINGGTYTDIPVEGIDESMLVMAGGLLLFVFLIIASKFNLLLWHAYLFFVLYAIFIADYVGRFF